MRANRLLLSVAVITTAGLSACGSIVNGGEQMVDVVVRGSPTAYCEFSSEHFRNAGRFPGKVDLERSHEDLQADCTGEQNRRTTFIIPAHMTKQGTAGNLPFGILPGIGYDTASGSLWGYSDPIIVDFREIAEGARPDWPADQTPPAVDTTRVGTADIIPPKPVRMQPIMDTDLNPAAPVARSTAPTPAPAPEIIDAVSLATQKKAAEAAAAPVPLGATTTTTTTKTTTVKPAAAKMKPVLSPEDGMGADPKAAKAKAAAKEKAKAQAAQKAKDAAAAKKRAAAEAKKAAAESTAKPAETLPEAPAATPPSEPAPATAAPAPEAAPAAATTTTTTTTTTAPAAAPATAGPSSLDGSSAAPPASTTSSTTTTTTTAPAPASSSSSTPPPAGDASKDDMDKYLQGK